MTRCRGKKKTSKIRRSGQTLRRFAYAYKHINTHTHTHRTRHRPCGWLLCGVWLQKRFHRPNEGRWLAYGRNVTRSQRERARKTRRKGFSAAEKSQSRLPGLQTLLWTTNDSPYSTEFSCRYSELPCPSLSKTCV